MRNCRAVLCRSFEAKRYNKLNIFRLCQQLTRQLGVAVNKNVFFQLTFTIIILNIYKNIKIVYKNVRVSRFLRFTFQMHSIKLHTSV